MRDDDRDAAVDALRDFNFEAQAFCEAVAGYFEVGVRETQAAAHLVARGQLGASDPSRVLNLSHATVTHLWGHLERAGLATVAADPTDLRRIIGRPTEHARALVGQVRDWLGSCLDGVADAGTSVDVVTSVLTALRAQLQAVQESLGTVGGESDT